MNATPGPIVSGKNFFPNAPLLCVKRILTFAVTSTKCTPASAPDEFAPVCAPCEVALSFLPCGLGAAFERSEPLKFGTRNEEHSRREDIAAAICFKASPGDRRGPRPKHRPHD